MTLLENLQYQDLVPFVTKPGVDVASDHHSDGQADLHGGERLGMEMMQANIRQASNVQDSEVHATNTQDIDTQDPDIEWLDSEDPESEDPDSEGPFNKESDTEEPEEQSARAPKVSPAGRASQEFTKGLHFVAPSTNVSKRIHNPTSHSPSKRVKATQQAVVYSGVEERGSTDEHQPAPNADNIPEQIRFFDLHFDHVSKEYLIIRLREDIGNWQDLQPDSTCTSQDETFRRGDLVHIKLHAKTDGRQGDDVARVEDIRILSVNDQRRLVLIMWLYFADGRCYESNHLQIVLWDTITRRATQTLANRVHPHQLYNVYGGKKFCSAQQAELWRARKAHMLSHGHSSGPK